MTDHETLEARLATLGETDPRVGEEYVRIVQHDGRPPVVLLGVVHDHPASVYRVRRVVDSVEPEILGLELPPLATPLFEQFAETIASATTPVNSVQDRQIDDSEFTVDEVRRSTTTPESAIPDGGTPDEPAARLGETAASERAGPGGEMSAAINAAGGARVVGVDMPDAASLTSLARAMWDERVSLETARAVVDDVGGLCWHALEGRLVAAGLLPARLARHDVEHHRLYDVTADDPAVVQADHEHSHVRRSRALHRSLEPPRATRLVDDVRERRIGARLVTLSGETTEPVVAVVGYDHLDRIADSMVEGSRE